MLAMLATIATIPTIPTMPTRKNAVYLLMVASYLGGPPTEAKDTGKAGPRPPI